MLGNGHVRFGRRAAETGQSKDRNRAAVRPHTEHWTGEGKLYLCAIKDCFSNKIVGYSIDSRMKARLASPHWTTPSPAAPRAAPRWPAASFTPIAGRNFDHGSSTAL
jgi:transposase InsO family protein